MRKTLLFGLSALLIFPFAAAQDPRISVNTTEIVFDLTSGDPVTMPIVIQNIGNRDLEFTMTNWQEKVDFQKPDWADWTLPENQDFIHENLIITRANQQGIFNIALESGFDNSFWNSPKGTLWNWGPTGSAPLGNYEIWGDAIGWTPPSMVGNVISMYDEETGIFYDIHWESWTSGGNGGGFAYTRVIPTTWLSFNPEEGLIEPLDSDSVMVMVDASDLFEGTYQGQIMILTNDPLNPEVEIPVTLIVGGEPQIEITADSLNFGEVMVGGTSSLQFSIANPGTSVLNVESISNTLSVFGFNSSAEVDPGMEIMFEVMFTPDGIQDYLDSLTLVCTDPDTTIVIQLTGSGIAAPAMEVNPMMFSYEIESGEVLSDSFLVRNTGDADLIYWFPGLYGADFWKDDYADWTQPENQDSIAPDVIITRADNQSIFNIAQEASYGGWGNGSPLGTEWALGSSSDPQSEYMQYSDLGQMVTAMSPYNSYSWYQPIYTTDWFRENYGVISLFLPDYGEYYDIEFRGWTQNDQGGGFGWLRTIPGSNLVEDWLTLSVAKDTLAPGDSLWVVFTGDATGAYGGEYEYFLSLFSNDPLQEMVEIAMSFTITGIPEISPADPALAFGNVYLGATSELELEIMNTGTDVLDISAMSTDSSVFMPVFEPFSVDPGESGFVSVMYMPEGLYTTEDTLYISSNDPATPVAKVVLSGTGEVAPEMSVEPLSLAGEAAAGSSDTVQVIISNASSSTALMWLMTSQHDTVFFEKEDYADWTEPANQDYITDNVIITRQDRQGLFNIAQELMYTGGSPAGTQWADSPTGIAVPGDYTSWQNAHGGFPPGMIGNTYSMYLTEEDLYFDVLLSHWTEQALGGGFAYMRAMAAPWLQFDTPDGSVTAGDTDTIDVILQAEFLNAGVYEGLITVVSDAPGNPSDQIPVTFTVTGIPEIMLSVDSVDFDTVYAGGMYHDSVMVGNSGTDLLEISVGAGTTGLFIAEPTSFELMPGGTAYLHIAYNPAEAGAHKDTLTITSNDPDMPEILFPLSGVALVAPEIQVWPQSFDYLIYPDSSVVDTLMITNTGAGDLFVDLSASGGWITLSDYQDTLSEGDTVKLAVTFDPGATPGEYEGEVTIVSNDPLSGEVRIEVHVYVNGIFEVNPLADVLVNEGFGMMLITIDSVFENAAGDSIGITPISSETGVVTLEVVDDSLLIVTETGTGSSVITLMARDAAGSREFSDFLFVVNAIPVISTPIADQTYDEGFGSDMIDLSSVFTDADGDVLVFSAESSDGSVVTVSVNENQLTITEAGLGSSNISVDADDEKGGMANTSFMATVVEVEFSVSPGLSHALILYPNPADGLLNISFDAPLDSDIITEVVDLKGRQVYLRKFEMVEDRLQIDLSNLPAGSYIMKLRSGKELLFTEEFVIH